MFETRTSARKNQQTPAQIIQSSTGNSKTKRLSITDAGLSISLPERVMAAIFHNAGSDPIRLRINATGSEYFTINPGVILPKILVNRSSLDAITATGTSSILECIFEG